jgi:chromodomain-helicase-DNA-binding protein 4
MGCKHTALEPESSSSQKTDGHVPLSSSAAVIGTDSAEFEGRDIIPEHNPPIQCKEVAILPKELLFRCRLCKRLAHYAHLPPPNTGFDEAVEDINVEAIAEHYQRDQDWSCADCISFVYRAEKILAWRPYPAEALQPDLPDGESISPKMHLPREYLVKWQDRSYRRVQWVPHGWLASMHTSLLRNFLLHGSRVKLLEHAVREDQVANAVSEGGVGGLSKESDGPQSKAEVRSEGSASLPSPDAERRIPPAWKTVDRVLDVLLWFPREQRSNANKGKKGLQSKMTPVDGAANSDAQREWNEAFDFGEVPSAQNTRTLEEWEAQKEDELSIDDIDHIVWTFIKWDDLGYDEGEHCRLQVRFQHHTGDNSYLGLPPSPGRTRVFGIQSSVRALSGRP